MALNTCLSSTHKLGGCIALSTWLPLRDSYPEKLSQVAAHLPILQVHGDADQVVSYEWGSGSHKILETMLKDPPPRFLTIEGMGHSSSEEEMRAVRTFIDEIFAK